MPFWMLDCHPALIIVAVDFFRVAFWLFLLSLEWFFEEASAFIDVFVDPSSDLLSLQVSLHFY